MKYLIISSHPYNGSFNAAAAEGISAKLLEKGEEVKRIDLVTDGFDPVMREEDLSRWRTGESADPHVEEYQRKIEEADVLVFPFPSWWGTMPAVLKGFCDKVLLLGWAYKYGEHGEMIGLLKGKKAIVINTMETPIDYYNSYFHNPIEGAFVKDTLQTCGIEVSLFLQIDKIVSSGREYAEKRMNELLKLFD